MYTCTLTYIVLLYGDINLVLHQSGIILHNDRNSAVAMLIVVRLSLH